MTDKARRFMPTILAVLIVVGAGPLVLPISEAEARPGSILRESRQKGTRTHRAANRRNKRSREESSSSQSRSRQRSRGSTNARPTGPPRATGNTRRVSPRPRQDRPRTHRSRSRTRYDHPRARHDRRPSVRDSQTLRRRHRRRASTTHVHITNRHRSHHHYESPPPQSSSEDQSQRQPSSVELYMTVGAGASGLAAPEISAIALPGNDFNLGLGAVNQLFGLELGFHSGLFTFNPDAIRLDVVLLGVSTDLKLQPSLGIFEPFVSAGIGAYNLHDTFLAESALGGSGRLAAGIDVRIAKFALSLRYQRNFYHFFNERSYYDGLDAQTESVGLNLSFYL